MDRTSRFSQRRKPAKRNYHGSQIPEFAAAIILLVLVVFVPMLDLIILPVRWMLAQEIVNGYSRRLALCETFSQAYAMMEADPSLKNRLSNLGGVTCDSINLRLRIQRTFPLPETISIEKPGTIPTAWLPNGEKAPDSFSLDVDVDAKISPALTLQAGGLSIPGLTGPVPMIISSSHQWENRGRNPITGKFFLQE